MANKSKKIGVITLGCDKNRVDTEFILTKLADAGFVFDADILKVDAVLVNTCSFIASSRQEGFENIADLVEAKKKNKKLKIVVCGCLAEKDSEEIKQKFGDMIDAIVGVSNYENIVQIVNDVLNGKKVCKIAGQDVLYFAKNRKITTPINYAYLKIADGCNNFCTFCRIPYIRGRYRSQTIEKLVEEAQDLASFGTTELVLVAQDVTKYGTDLYGKPMLVELIKKLSAIEQIKWIRLLYAYPESITDELIEEIDLNDKVCKYLDIPLQHVSSKVLKKMNRKSDYEKICTLVSKLRNCKHNIAIRSTFMVGFPGETEEDFEKLCTFLQEYPLNNVGFFKFSKEKDTVANTFEETVSEEEKERRLKVISTIQQKVSKTLCKKFKNKTIQVVVEGVNEDQTAFVGRSQYQAPDVDGVVYFYSDKELALGDYVNIKIKNTYEYDLEGEEVWIYQIKLQWLECFWHLLWFCFFCYQYKTEWEFLLH